MSEWKPIETMPKDKVVDCWHVGGFRVCDVWDTDDDTISGWDKSSFTHWMHQPSPPAA